MVGGAIGGAAGAAVGDKVGGSTGAVVGSGLGAAAGATIGKNIDEKSGGSASTPPAPQRTGAPVVSVRVDADGDDKPGKRKHKKHPPGHAYGHYKH